MDILDQSFMKLVEDLRKEKKISKTALSSIVWPDLDTQAALMRYNRLLIGQKVCLSLGASIADALSYDFARLIIIVQEQIMKSRKIV